MNTTSSGDPAPRASLAPATKPLLGRLRCRWWTPVDAGQDGVI